MPLTALPAEVLCEVALCLPSRTDKTNFAQVCWKTYDPAMRSLYLISYPFRASSSRSDGRCLFDLFIGTLSKNQSIGRYAQSFIFHDRNPMVRDGARGFETVSKMLQFAIQCMPNLRHMELSYAFEPKWSGDMSQMLERVELNNSPCRDDLAIDILQPLLELPRLRQIEIMAYKIDEQSLLDLIEADPRTQPWSRVEDLLIMCGNISEKMVKYLINAAIHLTNFNLSPLCCDATRPSSGTSGRLSRLSSTLKLLAKHASTIHSLSTERGYGPWHRNNRTINPLQYAPNLKRLDMSLDVLLGWNHCEHFKGRFSGQLTPPQNLAELLPTELELLTLYLEFHWCRNGPDYLRKALGSIVKDKERLCRLKKIAVYTTPAPHASSCDDCVWASASNDELNIGRYGIPRKERDTIKDMMAGHFDVSFRRNWERAALAAKEAQWSVRTENAEDGEEGDFFDDPRDMVDEEEGDGDDDDDGEEGEEHSFEDDELDIGNSDNDVATIDFVNEAAADADSETFEDFDPHDLDNSEIENGG